MVFGKLTPQDKRANFRAALQADGLLRFPGAHAPIVAMALARKGFEGIYISGGALSAELGLPDIGLTTLPEVAQRGNQIARVTELPTIIDVDTGFGEPMSAARTIQTMEDAGLAGCHLEDQVNPKRCGHLDGKEVVPRDEAARRIKAAASARRDANFLIIARTDARAVEGLDAAIDRAKAYIDAGAVMIFPEAMRDLSEFEAVAKAIAPTPVLANMTEFGKSELFSTRQLTDAGVKLVIYPVTSLRFMMGAVEKGFDLIRDEGKQTDAALSLMQTRKDLYELIRYEDYNAFDTSLFNFKV